MITFKSIEDLRQALVDAKDAHTEYEKQNGPDENWPLWYARFIAERPQVNEIKEHFGLLHPDATLYNDLKRIPSFLGFPAGKE